MENMIGVGTTNKLRREIKNYVKQILRRLERNETMIKNKKKLKWKQHEN